MAAFSNIPELRIAETLSSTMGNLVGSLGGKALTTANRVKGKIADLCDKVSNGDTSVLSEISVLEKTLDSTEKTVDGLDKSLKTLEKTASSLKGPLTALDIAIKVAKMVPSPVPPPVPVLIATLSELVAQIKQLVAALGSVAKNLRQILNTIRKVLNNARKMIQSIRAAISLMAIKANDALIDKGVVSKDGTNILGDVGKAIGTEDISLISIGGAEITQSVENTGDWISTVYIESLTKPATPTSRNFQPEGWSVSEPSSESIDLSGVLEEETESAVEPEPVWWYSKAVISGETDKVNGSWSEPKRYAGSGGSGDDLSGLEKAPQKIEGTISVNDFLSGEYGKSGAVLVVNGSEEAYKLLVDIVGIVGAAGISLEGQDEFRKTFGEQAESKNYYYTTPNGDVLLLKVVVDPKSPSIAPLYYVTATDVKTETIVYTGTKTFATDEEVLIKEAEVRLDRIFL